MCKLIVVCMSFGLANIGRYRVMTSNVVQIPFSRKCYKLQDFVKIKTLVRNIIYDTIEKDNVIMNVLCNLISCLLPDSCSINFIFM